MKRCRPYRPWLAANSAATSFTAPSALFGSAPSGNVITVCQGPDGDVPCHVKLIFFGAGDANDVFDVRLYGWFRVIGANGPGKLEYVPSLLAALTCTLGAGAGVAGAIVGSSELYVDTITINNEFTVTADTTRDGTIEIMSPATDLIAQAIVPIKGAEILDLHFDATTGDPTGMNALYSFL